jgi:hypothetical protein
MEAGVVADGNAVGGMLNVTLAVVMGAAAVGRVGVGLGLAVLVILVNVPTIRDMVAVDVTVSVKVVGHAGSRHVRLSGPS